ncbi:META domain-containing protein [Nocardioides sp. GCM10027113]|uniref:META domain-containing protein n=1 Tax=unclassified Nocardioides TaxID=2615069 RepID=UPI00360B2786
MPHRTAPVAAVLCAVLCTVLVAAGCTGPDRPPSPADGGGEPATPTADSDLLDGDWQLVAVRVGSRDRRPDPLHPVTMTVADGVGTGSTGCNEYRVPVREAAGVLRTGTVRQTLRSCPAPVDAVEQAFTFALQAADRAELTESRLTLKGDDVRLTFAPIPGDPLRGVVGSAWRLETLVTSGVSLPLAQVTPARGTGVVMRLRRDGSLEVATGCRDLSGRWERVAGQVVAGSLPATRRPPPRCPRGLRAQDRHVVRVLDGRWRPVLDGDVLTVQGRSGRALVHVRR